MVMLNILLCYKKRSQHPCLARTRGLESRNSSMEQLTVDPPIIAVMSSTSSAVTYTSSISSRSASAAIQQPEGGYIDSLGGCDCARESKAHYPQARTARQNFIPIFEHQFCPFCYQYSEHPDSELILNNLILDISNCIIPFDTQRSAHNCPILIPTTGSTNSFKTFLIFKYFKLPEDVVNRNLQVVLDLQHFKSSPCIFAATILQGSSAIHYISNIDNFVHQIIEFQSILITSRTDLRSLYQEPFALGLASPYVG
ncbi:hypothetical protein Tco_1338861 [Tanacetum coccineum]